MKKIKFITVGRLVHGKILIQLLTMSILKNKNIDFELVIVGSTLKKIKNSERLNLMTK